MICRWSAYSLALLGALFCFFLTGCGRREIQVYRVPKETQTVPPSSPDAGDEIAWTTPQGWQEQAISGMRIGSFLVHGSQGETGADVSMIRLTGEAGGLLDNVNRWRSQLALEPISDDQLTAQASQFSVGDIKVTMVDLVSSKPLRQAREEPVGKLPQSTRILAAILPQSDSTIFVKMMGEERLVESQKEKFRQFVQSLRFSAPTTGTSGPIATHTGDVQWKIPPQWKEQPLTAMRKGSFMITGQENARAEVSITSFGGMAGGVLANINRWRGQIGLPPLSETDLGQSTETIHIGEHRVTLVNMAGPQPVAGKAQRILGAITSHGEETWFFKISGDDKLVQSQKAALLDFLKSFRFP